MGKFYLDAFPVDTHWTWSQLKWWLSLLGLRPLCVGHKCLLDFTWEQCPSFLNWLKTFMQPNEPFEYHVSNPYLGSEIKDLISWTAGFHSTIWKFAARSQELPSFLSDRTDEALRERWSGHCVGYWCLPVQQGHTMACKCSLWPVPNARNPRGLCTCSC